MPVLVILTIGQHDAYALHFRRGKAFFERVEIQGSNDVVRNDHDALLCQVLEQELRSLEQARPDVDRITAITERDSQGAHVLVPAHGSSTTTGWQLARCGSFCSSLWTRLLTL